MPGASALRRRKYRVFGGSQAGVYFYSPRICDGVVDGQGGCFHKRGGKEWAPAESRGAGCRDGCAKAAQPPAALPARPVLRPSPCMRRCPLLPVRLAAGCPRYKTPSKPVKTAHGKPPLLPALFRKGTACPRTACPAESLLRAFPKASLPAKMGKPSAFSGRGLSAKRRVMQMVLDISRYRRRSRRRSGQPGRRCSTHTCPGDRTSC